MSKDLNKVQLTGRLGKDPETKYTAQGNAVTQFTVASNRRWRTADGQDQSDTEWFNVVAWNKLGEICAQYLHKGSKVYIEGRLQTRSWDDQESGQKRYRTEVIANDMIMLDSKNNGPGDYGDADISYNEPEPAPARSQAAPPARRPTAPTNGNGSAPTRPATRPTNGAAPAAPRRPAAVMEDDEDLPF